MFSAIKSALFVVLACGFLREGATLNCWMGATGGSTQGTAPAAQSTACGSSTPAEDTCKQLVVTPAGFGAIPTMTLKCVFAGSGTAGDAVDSADNLSCRVGTTPWNTGGTATAACTADSATTTGLVTGCTRSFTPTSTTATASMSLYCTQVAIATQTNGGKPVPASCLVGTTVGVSGSLTATANSGNLEFCKITFTGTTPGAAITASGEPNSACVSSVTVGCCNTANCNKFLACYVGAKNTITASTFAMSMCALASSGTSNQFCKNVYSYGPSTGVVITGSCEISCTAAPVAIASSSASGTTCCSTLNCNSASPPPPNAVRSAVSSAKPMGILVLVAMIVLLLQIIQ